MTLATRHVRAILRSYRDFVVRAFIAVALHESEDFSLVARVLSTQSNSGP